MASSEVKAKPGSDVTPVFEDSLDFDDDTLKGEDSCYSLKSEDVGLENCSILIFTVEREVKSVHGYSKLLRRSYKLFPVFGVVCLLLFLFACLFACLIDLVMFYRFLFSFYLFLTLAHLTSTQSLRLQALSQWVKQIQSRVLISRRRLSTDQVFACI